MKFTITRLAPVDAAALGGPFLATTDRHWAQATGASAEEAIGRLVLRMASAGVEEVAVAGVALPPCHAITAEQACRRALGLPEA